MPQTMTAQKAQYMIRTKAGTLAGAYYTVGVEVPPRHGSVFSMRYTTVPSATAGWALLRQKMGRKRVGMIGEVIYVSGDSLHTVSLGGYIRRHGGVLERVPGDINRRALSHEQFRAYLKTRTAA
jgi:hypothetical protein